MSTLVTTLDSVALLGRLLAGWLVPALPAACVLLAVALVIDVLVARHVRASLRIALYAPVALRVLVPTGWTFTAQRSAGVATFLTPVPDALLRPAVDLDAPHTVAWWAVALALGYVVVAAALAARVIAARVRLARLTRSARPYEALTNEQGSDPAAPIAIHDTVGPLVEGLLAPRVVLPARLVDREHAAALACVLAHELAHVRRRDPWLLALVQLVTVVAWPIVPVWIAAWRVRRLIEVACDEAAVAGRDDEARRLYGHTLLDLAENDAHAVAALGIGSRHFGSTLRARIVALASSRRWPRALQVVLVTGVVSVLGACGAARPADGDGAGAGAALAVSHGPTGDAAPRVEMREFYRCQDAGLMTYDREAQRLRLVEPPPPNAPAAVAARCRSPELIEALAQHNWASEARNGLAQIGKDMSAAYDASAKHGSPHLCPNTAPTPAVVPLADAPVQSNPIFKSDPGWTCMMFEFSIPTMFQYRVVSTDKGFAATAQSRRKEANGHLTEVTIVLRGKIDPNGELWIASSLEETWRTL